MASQATPDVVIAASNQSDAAIGLPRTVRGPLAGLPLAFRWALIGAIASAVVGGVAGGAVGLSAYPPTAWFAVFELGVPAAILGALGGLVAGTIAAIINAAVHDRRITGADRPRWPDTVVAAFTIVATIVEFVALASLEWATFTNGPDRQAFSGGPTHLVVMTAAMASVLAVLVAVTHRAGPRWIHSGVALGALLSAMAVADTRMAAAATAVNQMTQLNGVASTSPRIGCILGLAAGGVIAVAGVVALVSAWGRDSLRAVTPQR